MASSIHLFGASHSDRYSNVQAEIEDRVAATDAEAICIEAPEERIRLTYWVSSFLRLPLFVTGFAMVGLFQLAGFSLLARSVFPGELRAAREVHTERGIPLHEVDPHFRHYFSAGGLWFVLLNWAVLVGAAIVFSPIPVAIACVLGNVAYWCLRGLGQVTERLTVLIAVPGVFLFYMALFQITSFVLVVLVVGLGMAALVVGSKLTAEERTEEMISGARTAIADNEYENVLYVAGQRRTATLRDSIAGVDDVELGSVWLKDRSESGELERPVPDE